MQTLRVCQMRPWNRLAAGRVPFLLVPLLLVLGLAQCVSSAEQPHLTGNWGGEGARLRATDDHVTFEFNCAHGHAKAPLRPDASGHFSLDGVVTHRLGGPVSPDQTGPRPVSATYTGRVLDGRMVLEVKSGNGRHLGPFHLIKDQPAVLEECV